jgi:hypothetical protein
MFGQHYSKTPYSALHTDRPSSADRDILMAEEESPEQLRARLHLMFDDMSDHHVMIALPPMLRARGPSPPATTIVNKKPLLLAATQFESSSNTPVMQRARRVRTANIKTKRVICPHSFCSRPVPPDVAPVGQCVASTRLYLARSQTWSCDCAFKKGAFLRTALQRYEPTSPPLRGTVVPPPSAKSSENSRVQ